ncbi:energy-coupling factor transporter transmembrane component T family protein [Marinactinospora thermotolerans]|uniref:Energy-coupling factor transport system permease protein n=1 Tax=Marinactinospora thermotolerans DSM 45154 TaxID=1122192 RepID=A0A1T4SEG3_9ACTN|nr:energy-coupling factor transporter transmembrane component T [Marinactinospora thermotolerans]SKA26557.1 energy-coupling factor transport system permease protein [Marinactinospora thermotolerans DSM 45154]
MSTVAPRDDIVAEREPSVGGARTWLRRVNPAAKLLAALIMAFGLLVVVDPVTGGVALAAGLALVPFSGVGRRTLLLVGVPFLVMGLSSGVVNLLFGEEGALGALGAAIRVMAIALPGVLAGVTTDPTDLADALVQRLRVPERPALGALAALRLVPLLAGQWRTLTLARRARGLDAGGNPVTAAAIFAGKVFALLVRSIRTGTLLATAMEARAFGTGPRTQARNSPWGNGDTAVVAGAVLVVAAAHGTSLAVGTWTPLFG